MFIQVFDEQVDLDENLDLPIATRRAPRNLNKVAENIDILPQAHPSLPPQLNSSFEATNGARSPAPAEIPSLTVIHSARNIFGLSRKYLTTTLPPHDPEELVTLKDLCCRAGPTREPTLSEFYHPYPNRNSFLLGDWYWNGGVQKSQQSFADLLKIVGDSSFNPADIQYTRWSSINVALGCSEKDSTGEWLDTHAGWSKTPIQIAVPFHRRTKQPGAQLYVGGDLYHRSIMDIVGERIRDPESAQHFHFQPYELLWDAQHLADSSASATRVHGELYNSPAFLDAHRKLQEGPGEPGCDLPRVVVALMFWSDATHLTSFGNTKIWPMYLFFGNESKYRRCQPSNNLCCHVAYFQEVSLLVSIIVQGDSSYLISYLITSKILPLRKIMEEARAASFILIVVESFFMNSSRLSLTKHLSMLINMGVYLNARTAFNDVSILGSSLTLQITRKSLCILFLLV